MSRKIRDIKDRLIDRRLIIGECWRYLGTHDRGGKGTITVDGRKVLVSRLSASIYLGFDLNSKLNINHKLECKFADCWNPDHLYAGTQADNNRDTVRSGNHVSGYALAKLGYRSKRIGTSSLCPWHRA